VTLGLDRLDGQFAVVRLSPDAGLPHWAVWSSGFLSVSRTAHETSVICEERLLPEGVRAEGGFEAYVVRGPLDFSAVGILARLTAPLAAAGIPLLAVSTFDTDVLLVRATAREAAVAAWGGAGIAVEPR
jgi:hypothetical protein